MPKGAALVAVIVIVPVVVLGNVKFAGRPTVTPVGAPPADSARAAGVGKPTAVAPSRVKVALLPCCTVLPAKFVARENDPTTFNVTVDV